MARDITIFAPHPDDELIGCYSLLAAGRVSHVVYFFDLTDTRREEVDACAKAYGFVPIFKNVQDFESYNAPIGTGGLIYLPNRNDSHPEHKAVNSLRRFFNPEHLRFYSVDLQTAPQKVKAPGMKKCAMDYVYPSQKALWANNASYYLFEAITKTDIQELVWHSVYVGGQPYRVGAPEGTDVLPAARGNSTVEQMLNHVAATCPVFEIQLLDEEGRIKRSWK